ncbi:hypothetical protein DESC_880097 [Desulfosarcina cetonica]|nr:hypothetical protein DESC_880097 [Desulfosarcina cetonica]
MIPAHALPLPAAVGALGFIDHRCLGRSVSAPADCPDHGDTGIGRDPLCPAPDRGHIDAGGGHCPHPGCSHRVFAGTPGLSRKGSGRHADRSAHDHDPLGGRRGAVVPAG